MAKETLTPMTLAITETERDDFDKVKALLEEKFHFKVTNRQVLAYMVRTTLTVGA